MQHHKFSQNRSLLRAPVAGALLVSTLFSAVTVRADVTPFVDYYTTNASANKTTANNAALNLLGGYSLLWNTGTAWNTGSPTTAGATIVADNIEYVANITTARTQAQAEASYLIDRRDQSYSSIAGLGNLAAAYRTGAGAYTTISSTIPSNALSAKYDDKGNGAGVATSSLGKVVTRVQTLRGNYSSTSPAKSYFLSPRPWRLNTSGAVVSTGTETTGYYTSTLSDGTPDTTASLTYFPAYDTPVAVNPYLRAVRSTTPASDGGFPSGHTNAGYLASIALAYAVPQRFDSLILNASEIGNSRIVAGMHSPLEVMGGRILATALAAAILNDSANAAIKADACSQAQSYFASTLDNDTPVTQSEWVAGKTLFTQRLTYGLPATGSTTAAAIVPKGAETLLETRFAYLDAAQRREVLRTTEIASGHAVEDSEGWSRLNLYAASGAYGRFDSTVTVNMDASKGGLSAKDYWRNDITGTGGLIKKGSGTLVMSGANTYTGTVRVEGGKLVVQGGITPSAIYVGDEGTDGTLAIESGAVATCAGCYVGVNGAGAVSLAGKGSLLDDSGVFTLGSKKKGIMAIDDNALLVTGGAVIVGDYGTVYLSGGYWAVKGDMTPADAVTSYSIKVYNGSSWSAASASSLAATYYDGAMNVWSSSSLYATYGSKIDLTGYTVITGGSAYLGWSDCGAPTEGWNDSSWYGLFYSDASLGNWIYHSNHGWQYVFDAGDSKVNIYDSATGNWWFTSESVYPYVYDYSAGTWLFYVGGETPNRTFWSYKSNGVVSESSL
jgi:autotransporter-associated beta strand protein